ncbi:MAG: hypothetical protein M1323_04250 [Candidatus Thermoplasmatota archaeon]|nr:hypothetical protein [Candidatus Thermoplasmatota archaeon]
MDFNIVGHRGVPVSHPENSMESFQQAKNCGLFGIELDVQITRDSRIVVFHDSTLKRVTGAEGSVSDYSFSELSRLDLMGSDQKIPLLSDVLKKFQDMKIFIELKTRDEFGNRINEGLEAVLHNTLQNFSKENLILISFDVVAIREMKEMNLNYRTGLDVAEETRIMLDSMLKSKVPGFIDCILPQFSLLNYPEYSGLNKLGKKIIPWTINDKNELNVLRTMEIDTFLSDRGCDILREIEEN